MRGLRNILPRTYVVKKQYLAITPFGLYFFFPSLVIASLRKQAWQSLRADSCVLLIRHCEGLPSPRHCEGHGSGPWQSLFWVSQYILGTRDCHVAKMQAPRNDNWGVGRPFRESSLRACASRRGNLSFGFPHSRSYCPQVPQIATSGQNTPLLAMTAGERRLRHSCLWHSSQDSWGE